MSSYQDRFVGDVCGCCARRATGIGYSDKPFDKNTPILWICDDVECIKRAKGTYKMKQDEFNDFENNAALEGGKQAGAFLDQIGKTDLRDLTQEQWGEFCRRMITGYRNALKTILDDEIPF